MLARQREALPLFQDGAFEAFEFTGWETLAGAYDDAWGHVTGAFVDPLLAALGDVRGRSILDVATGPGYGARRAAEKGAQARGIDFSPNMIARAQRLNPTVPFEIADACALPFADASFDGVISNFGAQHFADLDRVFAEFLRVLKPGGVCAFTVWADNALNAAGEVLDHAVALHAEGSTQVPTGPDYHELSDARAHQRFLIERGFDPATVHSLLVTVSWKLTDPDELYEAELKGSVRSGARLREQAPPVRAKIRETMAALVRERYETDGTYALPMAAYVLSGRRL